LECLHFHVDGQLLKEMLEALRNECICLLIWLKYGTFQIIFIIDDGEFCMI
jgi:hypothetical protein